MARKYFDWDPLVLEIEIGEDTFVFPFLGRWATYEKISAKVGVIQHKAADHGPFVPYMIEQLTGNAGVAQNYRISGAGTAAGSPSKSTKILIGLSKVSDALGASGVVGDTVSIGGDDIVIASISQVQKDTIR